MLQTLWAANREIAHRLVTKPDKRPWTQSEERRVLLNNRHVVGGSPLHDDPSCLPDPENCTHRDDAHDGDGPPVFAHCLAALRHLTLALSGARLHGSAVRAGGSCPEVLAVKERARPGVSFSALLGVAHAVGSWALGMSTPSGTRYYPRKGQNLEEHAQLREQGNVTGGRCHFPGVNGLCDDLGCPRVILLRDKDSPLIDQRDRGADLHSAEMLVVNEERYAFGAQETLDDGKVGSRAWQA